MSDIKQQITSLGDIPRVYGKQYPDKPALIFAGRETSYAALHQHTNQVANGLRAAGCLPQSRVVFLGKNSDQYFELLLGAGKANVVLAPLNWRLAPAELEVILADVQPAMIFVEEEFQQPLKEFLSSMNCQVLVMESGFACWRNAQPAEDPGLSVGQNDVVLQLYTSGTTGQPKGVQLTNAGLFYLRQAEEQAGSWAQWQSSDVSLVAMPVFHIGGTGWGFTGLYNGATNVIMKQAEPVELMQLVETYKVKKLFAVPALLLFIVQYPESTPQRFKHVEVVLYGASPIPEDLLKQAMALFSAEFVQLYGMTETGGSMTYLPPDQHQVNGQGRLKSCGKPLPGIAIKVVDGEGNSLAANKVGEIVINSPSIMKGYWQRDEETGKVLQKGWYHTGDAGYLDDEGYLYIYDRVKDMIVSGGENIYPAEVESVLFEHPQVSDAAVIGVPSDKWGEAVKAVVVRKDGTYPSEEQLIEHCRRRLGGYKVPKSVDFVTELPRNPSGKLLKKDLKKPYWQNKERMVN